MFEHDSEDMWKGHNDDYGPYIKRRHVLMGRVGNSMDISTCGAVWLYILLFVYRLDQTL